MKAVPLWAWARPSTYLRCEACTSTVRATKVALAPSAKAIGSTGWSMAPSGVDFVFMPRREVGEYWPFVSP